MQFIECWYSLCIQFMQRNMSDRFLYRLLLNIPDWVINPFLCVSSTETGGGAEEALLN